MSGMLRMTYVTEVLSALRKHAGAAYEHLDTSEIQLQANVAINQRQANWYKVVLNAVAKSTGQSVEAVKKHVEQWSSMTDSMKYVQLGHPESVVIVEEDAVTAFEEEADRVTSIR